MDTLIKQHPILTMIKNMTETKMSDRLDIENLATSIDNARETEIQIKNSEIFNEIEKMIDDDMDEFESTGQVEDIFRNDLDHLS